MASNAENVSNWWRHHVITKQSLSIPCHIYNISVMSTNFTKLTGVLYYFVMEGYIIHQWSLLLYLNPSMAKVITSIIKCVVISLNYSQMSTVQLSDQPILNTYYGSIGLIKWKHFPCYLLFVRGIHGSPVNSPHRGQWRGALMFSLIWAWINRWVNNRETGDWRRHRAHYDVIVMTIITVTVNDFTLNTTNILAQTNITIHVIQHAYKFGCVHFCYNLSIYNTKQTQQNHVTHCRYRGIVYELYRNVCTDCVLFLTPLFIQNRFLFKDGDVTFILFVNVTL